MSYRTASAAVLALSLALPASALAQNVQRGPGPAAAYETVDPGLVGSRGVDASAKGGNAAQPERLVPQYGNTAGGPAD